MGTCERVSFRVVFYVLTHNDLTVTVMRIMYGGRDIDRQLEILEIE